MVRLVALIIFLLLAYGCEFIAGIPPPLSDYSSQPLRHRQHVDRLAQHWIDVGVHVVCELRIGVLKKSLGLLTALENKRIQVLLR